MSDFQKVINKLLLGNKLNQPFIYDQYKTSYRADLETRLENFIGRLAKFDGQGEIETFFRDNLGVMEDVTNNILRVIDAYLCGSAGKAYDCIEELLQMRIIKNNIKHLIHNMSSFSSDNSLYRVRKSNTVLTERKEIFHIPFELRHLVATQRYSIAGLPSLYLGTSVYVCWQEMGKPDLNSLYLSRYLMRDQYEAREVNVLNFAYSLETLKEQGLEQFFVTENTQSEINTQIAYIVLFPILMACSYNRAHENASFHPEYIFPNLLLQWISKEKSNISGISYYSTKTKQLRHHNIGINFVFPPDTDKVIERGFCPSLSKWFQLTKPVSWQLLETINAFKNNNEEGFLCANDLEEEFVRNYNSTRFAEIEVKLKKIMKIDDVII